MYNLKQGTAIDSDRSLDKCFFVIDRSQAKLSEKKNTNKKQKNFNLIFLHSFQNGQSNIKTNTIKTKWIDFFHLLKLNVTLLNS